jgi:hypothetical protein
VSTSTKKPKPPGSKSRETPEADPYLPNAVSLRASYWQLLRDVADARADRGQPGRRSVSRVIAQLIDRHRRNLEHELE